MDRKQVVKGKVFIETVRRKKVPGTWKGPRVWGAMLYLCLKSYMDKQNMEICLVAQWSPITGGSMDLKQPIRPNFLIQNSKENWWLILCKFLEPNPGI